MTEKRFIYDNKQVAILKNGEFWLECAISTACNHSEICNELNKLVDENEQLKENCKNYGWYRQYKTLLNENEQLKKILNELSDMLQFDVENGIRSYPVKLSEYLSNALKELQE